MKPAPGSLLWLAANDLRLSRRRFADMFRGLGPRGRTALLVVAAICVHALAIPVGQRMSAAGVGSPSDQDMLWGGAAAGFAFAMSWMTAQSLLNATRTLFVRGDLDLLLSAPIPARRIAAARLLSMATESFAAAAVFLLPIANAAALAGDPRWLGLYPALAAASLVAASIGMALTLVLFQWFGPRRTRAVAQILATIIGAAVALSIQAAAVLPADLRLTVISGLATATEAAGASVANGSAWLPVQAASGEPVPLAIMIILSAVIFWGTARCLGRRFVAGALKAAGTDATAAPRRRRRRSETFVGGVARSIRRKEWRLLSRDPWIIGQLFLQIVYTLPIALILWRSGVGHGSPLVAATPSLVVIAAQISGALAWIAISGEDAPEFMATAPVSRTSINICKLQVIGAIVASLLAIPLLALLFVSWTGTLVAMLFCLIAGTSTSLINFWHPTEGRRRSFMRRHQQSKLVGMLEHALALLWALTAVLAIMGSWAAIAPGFLAILVLTLAWRWLAGGRIRSLLRGALIGVRRMRATAATAVSIPA